MMPRRRSGAHPTHLPASAAAPASTEERLMARYAAGDQLAFQQLFSMLAPRIHAFFMRSFSDEVTIADDLMQLTFLRIHRTRGSYRPERPLKPWVFTIAA